MDKIEELKEKMQTFELLCSYPITYGIMPEDENKSITVSFVTTDGETDEHNISIGSAMYLTEAGTLTIPAKHLLEGAYPQIKEKYVAFLTNCFERIMDGSLIQTEIEQELTKFCLSLEFWLRTFFEQSIDSSKYVSKLLQTDEDGTRYLLDFNILKNYIKCVYKKQNSDR